MSGYLPQQFMKDGGAGTLERGTRHNPTGTPSGPYAHGNGGLFSQAGPDLRMFSAMNMPDFGLINAIPVIRSEVNGGGGGYTSPLFNTFTGITKGAAESIANQPTQPCNDGPQGGLAKLCTLVAPMGRFRFKVGEIDIETIGDVRDQAEPMNMQLANSRSVGLNFGIPGLSDTTANILRNDFLKKAFETSYSAARMFAERIYVGSPANSTSSNYWKDIVGLDIYVNADNKRDAYTQNLCTALNSDIKDFGYSLIGGTTRDICRYLDSVFAWLRWNARQQGLNPVVWVIAMRPELFDELVMIWPVRQYQEALRQMAQFSGGQVNLAANSTLEIRDAMRDGQYLPIRGMNIGVVLDEFIAEKTPNQTTALLPGQYASDIYIIPLTVMGGIPVTYIQPYNMANSIAENVVTEGRLTATFTTDGGIFRWYVYEKGGCVSWNFATRFRLLMHTPQLAARIINVAYEPLQHFRSSNPDSSYFADGGRTTGVQQKYYTEWGGSTPQLF